MEDKYSVTTWGQSTYDLECPSGQTCLVRNLDMSDLIDMDIVDQADTLSGITAPDKKQPKDRQKSKKQQEQDQAREIMRDKQQFRTMSTIMERIVACVVLKPDVHLALKQDDDGNFVRLPDSERTNGVVYTDSIGFEDKMHIFQSVFSGVQNMASFREESEQSVGDMESEQNMDDTTKQSAKSS